MKFIKYSKIAAYILSSMLLFAACENTLEVDSERVDFPGNQSQNNIHMMIGIFSEMENLAVPYVLMGELRADLMEARSDADLYLKEIYNNEVSEDNPYNVKADYYSLINHCNYVINNMDTSIIEGGENIYLREYAAAKAFRAWTYMQLALNYGEAIYIEEPLLDIKEANDDFPTYTMAELAPVLINDILPWVGTPWPESIKLGDDVSSEMIYFEIRALLGDLFLWMGDYELAAKAYYAYIVNEGITVPAERNLWDVDDTGSEFTGFRSSYSWTNDMFDLGASHFLTNIANSLEYGKEDVLNILFVEEKLLYASPIAIENWASQAYYGAEGLTQDGDLRGDGASYFSEDYFSNYYGASEDIPNRGYIRKFMSMSSESSTTIAVNRASLLYLRYAEALNRSGRPNTALAVLKYGLDEQIFEVDSLVPRHELYINPADSLSGVLPFIDFSMLTSQIGIHDHGCGASEFNEELVIPNLPSLQDSIKHVEDLIVMELALETAFEGNRFHDLMRVAKRRGDNSYLASRVGAKYNDGGAKAAELMNENNWYLP